jgi:hypothetical protein
MTLLKLVRRPPDDSESLTPGMQVHEWKVGRALGQARNGTFHEVERAGRRSVMKWVAPGPETRRLVNQELACLRRLGDPLFAGLETYGYWPDAERGGAFLVLEDVPGMPLTQWYRHSAPFPHEVVQVFERICHAMGLMHDAGVRYPRLTCAEIKVRTGTLDPVIIDMGGALAEVGPIPDEETISDAQGLGAMLYEILTRQQPGPIVVPPHMVNPQIPRILSELTMHLMDV